MTWKQIETSREVRLWVGQIIVPATAVVVGALSIPGVRENIKSGCGKIKSKIKKPKFKVVK